MSTEERQDRERKVAALMERDIRAAEILAIRLELNPADILWEESLDIKQKVFVLVWHYKEIVRDEHGEPKVEGGSFVTVDRRVAVPPELFQEFLNHKEHGVPGE